MEVIREDALLASEVVALLGRELKVIKAKNKKLEQELQEEKQSRKTDTERAEAAEVPLRAPILNIERMGKEDQVLRPELRQMRLSSRSGLVKEEDLIDPSLPSITDLLAQNNALREQLKWIQDECGVERKERQRLHLVCCSLERENEELRREKSVAQPEDTPRAIRDARFPEGNAQQETSFKRMVLTKEDITLLRTFFEYLPKLLGLEKHSLAHVGSKAMVTDLQLIYDNRLSCWSQSILYVPHSITNDHYGLAFFPSHILHNGQWVDAVSKHEGQRREVFCTLKGETYYTGTYQCDLPPPEWFGRSGTLTHYIAGARSRITQLINDAGINPPPNFISHGTLRIKCLALRYVGFDGRIPAALSKSKEVTSVPVKRKVDETGPVPRKKSRAQ